VLHQHALFDHQAGGLIFERKKFIVYNNFILLEQNYYQGKIHVV